MHVLFSEGEKRKLEVLAKSRNQSLNRVIVEATERYVAALYARAQ